MLFASLQDRLISHIRNRVRAGELTERGLARLTGMSQPHLHNVLKGVRSLSPAYTDQILLHLDLSVLDLITSDEWQERNSAAPGLTSNVPVLGGIAGPQQILEQRSSPIAAFPLARLITDPLTDPVLVILGHDAQLFPHFQNGDVALVTRSPITPSAIDADDLYLVKTANGTLVRSVHVDGTRLYLFTPATRNEPSQWEELSLSMLPLSDVILGKLTGVARQLSGDSVRPFVNGGQMRTR